MSEQDEARIRASDGEREAVVSVLREAMGEGRLTLAEGEERIAAVYAATYRDELPAFAADLPSPESPPAGATRPRGEWPGRDWQRGEWPGRDWQRWRRDRRGPRPVAGLIAVAALAAGIWAVLGHAIWPAIVLGIIAIMLLKGGGVCQPRRDYAQRGPATPQDT